MLRRHPLLPFLTLLVFSFPLPFTPANSAASSGPSKAWKLAFMRNGDIWIANADGTGQHRIIRNGDVPCWSPDKKKIAFERDSNIWVANADGSHQKPLTHQWGPIKRDTGAPGELAEVENIGIAWDKNLAIFYSHAEKRSDSSWTSASTSIVTIPLGPLDEGLHMDGEASVFAFSDRDFPAVSRSGNYCAFICNGDLWIAARDMEKDDRPGWNITRLDPVAQYDHGTNRGDAYELGATHISWAPNERSLAYSFDRLNGTGTWEIHVLQIHPGRMTPSPGRNRTICDDGTYPSFSPDGKWIAYWGPDKGSIDPENIWIMTSTGSHARLLIKNGSSPAW